MIFIKYIFNNMYYRYITKLKLNINRVIYVLPCESSISTRLSPSHRINRQYPQDF